MSRLLDRPVPVRIGDDGRPLAFLWQGRWQPVEEVLEEWVYRTPWWDGTPAGERTFHRVRTAAGGLFDLSTGPGGGARVHRAFD